MKKPLVLDGVGRLQFLRTFHFLIPNAAFVFSKNKAAGVGPYAAGVTMNIGEKTKLLPAFLYNIDIYIQLLRTSTSIFPS